MPRIFFKAKIEYVGQEAFAPVPRVLTHHNCNMASFRHSRFKAYLADAGQFAAFLARTRDLRLGKTINLRVLPSGVSVTMYEDRAHVMVCLTLT